MRYKVIEDKEFQILGLTASSSFVMNAEVTKNLASAFMPRLKDIEARVDDYTLSLQNYSDFNFKKFNPNTTFEKWIGVEVKHLNTIPIGLEVLTIPAGRYLVIDFKGSIAEFIKLWQYIHSTWLPDSEFQLDQRPHFERLPSSYSPMNTVNTEEIWIPIR